MSYQIKRIPRAEGGGRVKPIINDDMARRSNGKIFSHPFTNTALIAKKASGKTSLIFHIIKKLVNRHTVVFIFCPSHNGDQAWQTIKQWLDDRETPYFCYYSPQDDVNGSDSENDDEGAPPPEPVLQSLAQHLKKAAKMFDDAGKRSKANTLLIFDDLGQQTRDKLLSNLMRRNRHHRCNIICSVQNATDIMPAAIAQLDNALISRGNTIEKLEHIYKLLDLPIEFNDFLEIYQIATEPEYSFLNIDVRKNKYKRGFEEEISPV